VSVVAEMSEQQERDGTSRSEAPRFFTIGHSTRSIPDFVELLRAGEVQVVVDVRSIRRSRRNPQFNEETLGAALEPYQVGYVVIPELGGRRSRQKSIDEELNGFWRNTSFHNYADYALTDPFRDGLEHLLALGSSKRCVIMCAESVWWRCHRRIIADYLLQRGVEVCHLMDGNKVIPAELTEGALVINERRIVYPPVRDGNAG